MLNAIVSFALRFRGVVVALALLLAVYGVMSLGRVRLDVFPEFAPPQVIVQTEAPGLSPEQVEVLVTQPLENALQGVTGLASLRSASLQGLSKLTVTFHDGTDIYIARQQVAEQLAVAAARLPQLAKRPEMLPLASATADVLSVGFTSDTRSPTELRTFVDWVVRPQLLAVPGVAGMAVFGGDVKQLQIQLDPERLARYGLSIDQVVRAARRATGLRGAGFIETANQRIVIVPQGQPSSAAALAAVAVREKDGAVVTLGDVATVTQGPAPRVGAALVMGKPGVVIVLQEQYRANTVAVTRALEARLESLRPVFAAEAVEYHPDLFRPANFIQAAIAHLRIALAVGAVLVIAVLFLFLFSARAAAISALAIPLSLLAAVVVLDHFGIGLNTMTLGGLAIALGEVVDDAIIDVENIFRRLRQNRLLPQPRPVLRVVLQASLEVRHAVVYATFVVALVFVPILTLSGVTGRLFGPLALAYLSAIMASLAVALTLTPALASLLISGATLSDKEPPLMRWLKQRYTRLLSVTETRAGATMAVVALLCAAGFAALPFLDGQLLPQLREGHYVIHMKLDPGSSLAQTVALGRRVSDAVAKISGVRSVAERIGRAAQVNDPAGVYSSEFEVELKPLGAAGQQRVLDAIYVALSRFAGANFSVNTFLTERIGETISGYTAPVVVNLYGDNLDVLDRKAQDIAAILRRIPGAAGVQVQSPAGSPQLVIRLRTEALARWGIPPLNALQAIETAYGGTTVGQVYEGNRVFDVSVMLDPRQRKDPAQVRKLALSGPQGQMTRLGEVADIYQTSGRFIVLHDDAQRLQTVTANLRGRALSSFVAEAQRRIATEAHLPKGTYVVFAGQAQERTRAQRELLLRSLFAAAGVILLLFIALRSARSLLLVCANLPFALLGGVVMVVASGGVLSIGSLVGFVTLFGITLRNSIMLISHYQHLVSAEGMAWGREAARRGAAERLTPILMTALVTALGLLPLALTSGAPGNEIEGPMAMVILGGLVTSTLLNLLVMPTLALRYGRFHAPRAADLL